MDEGGRQSLSKNERMLRVIANDGRTDKGWNSNNVPCNLRRERERSIDGKKGKETNPVYFRKPIVLGAEKLIYSIEHIKRKQYKKADALSKLASMTFSKLAKDVLVEVIQNKSIIEKGVADIAKEEGDN
ncbi:hypothetical protein Tco_0631019 [Tanacetum coccineum]